MSFLNIISPDAVINSVFSGSVVVVTYCVMKMIMVGQYFDIMIVASNKFSELAIGN